jgi:DNA polymerase
MGYSEDGGDPKLWVDGDPPPEWVNRLDEITIVCHNAGFEKAIWEWVMVKQLGWPPVQKWYDTMATCARKVLPLKLERAAAVLGLKQQKDMEGAKALKRMTQPDKHGNFDMRPETVKIGFNYCRQDIRTEVELLQVTGRLSPDEMRVWEMDQQINYRGVQIDIPFVRACQTIADQALIPLAKDFANITGGLRATQRQKFLDLLHKMGAPMPNLKKETVEETLEDQMIPETEIVISDEVDHLLRMRTKLTATSLAKLDRMAECAGADGRAHNLLQYHGAGTGRWSGRMIQPQNFPRGKFNAPPDDIITAIMTEDAEYVSMLYGCPIDTITTGLRHAITSAPGKLLVVRDFSTIEARIVLALAGQHDKVELLRRGDCIYCAMGTEIYDFPVEKRIAKDDTHADYKKHAEARQDGKNAVLGLGFQMGHPKFRARYAKKKSVEFAQDVVATYREEFAPCVPKLWAGLEEAALNAAWEGGAHEAFGVVYQVVGKFMTARLPSGRVLYYYDPRPIKKHMPWSTPERPVIRRAWSYKATKTGKWVTCDAYGGLLTENVVQALARDLMVNGMFKAEENGFPIVLTVHDELVCEVETSRADDKVLGDMMADVPKWAQDLQIPIATEGFVGERYKK